ncbi:GNAT family N-acetyltransferase [Aquipuribacter sp. SD81]|uniref:GNAT family N-acetyltransferase n=1 Tax=Aquipuribacter sp. SD81 TaxID=3127703 RepID=UPI0030180A5C
MSEPGAASAGAVPVRGTERLVLRGFTDADREPFAALNADPAVMEHFPEPYGQARSDAFVDRILRRWLERGYGLWALERRDTGAFIGYTGLWPAEFEAPFTPAVEVGWRLAREHWGHGFASEAARESLRFGFTEVGLAEVVSFTATPNERSWRVMERIGLRRVVDGDFDHPGVPEGHRLRRHVLYRLTREQWKASGAT